ncbi:hypothetical protein [Acetobacter peroxydans]|uniref:DUF5666 domain-containing protein n=1 Tax=Acetobacter peroxydans TaxID=104098 RepID=A0A4Y3TWF6_9PROT|nr:hypothetical protein [Acetobacter peroxydans]NHO16301.1 hypothetical protein [Acetobacter peroxydans]GBR38011.1 hypothetical protein AA13755_2080 [Acetobacter peroxydans NBRC 13755]GBR43186.1 hypothetical protein AA0475_1749 [Acetobacter peroxydans]GEB85799.1 hypothetical protein APE01nite_15960 [Acetobacter peroxydans]
MRSVFFLPACVLACSALLVPVAHAHEGKVTHHHHTAAAKPAPAPAPVAPAATGNRVGTVYDLSVLPVFTGKVVQFLPSTHGGINGFILDDGTQVLVSAEQGHAFAGLVKPGDTVDIRGLKGQTLPILRAFLITSPRGRSMEDSVISMPNHSTEMLAGPDLVLHGPVWMPLYNMNGKLMGAVLKDHSVLYLTPPEATRFANLLKPGQTVYAVGSGSNGGLGTAIDVREIGPSLEALTPVAVNQPPPPGPAAGSAAYDIIPGSDAHE